MATALMPQAFSHAAISWRSAVLPPNWRTGSASRSAGTQTMCMSEWTSIPAASGLMIFSGAVEVGIGTGTDLARGLAGFRGGLGLLGPFGSSFGMTMDRLRFADGGSQG